MLLMRFVCSFAWADLEVKPEERKLVARLIRRPSTNVPLRLLRSAITQPSPVCWITACRRERPGNCSTRSHSVLRPITTSGWLNCTVTGWPSNS